MVKRLGISDGIVRLQPQKKSRVRQRVGQGPVARVVEVYRVCLAQARGELDEKLVER